MVYITSQALGLKSESREFLKEVEVLKKIAKVNHPHIVKVYETPRGIPVIVFKYCEGGSIADIISSGHRLRLRDVLVLIAKLQMHYRQHIMQVS